MNANAISQAPAAEFVPGWLRASYAAGVNPLPMARQLFGGRWHLEKGVTYPVADGIVVTPSDGERVACGDWVVTAEGATLDIICGPLE